MKPWLFLLMVVLFAVPAAGWVPVTVTDDTGFVSVIASEPERIVSLSPASTEILFALGLGDKVVGVTGYCNYPSEAKTRTIIGGYTTISTEKIVALQPDLVIGSTGNGKDNIDHLRKLGLTVVCLDPDSVEGTFHAIRTVGTAAGAEPDSLISSMQQRIRNVSTLGGLRVAHIMSTDPFWVSGAGTFQDELITLAGGKNAFSGVDGWGSVSLEALLVADPDIILTDSGSGMEDYGENRLKQQIESDPRLQTLSAVRNGRVYVMNSDIFDRGGPRLADALEALSGLASVSPPETQASSGIFAVLPVFICLFLFRR
jgi:iron complex transport system substrate-binding protein